MNNRQMFSTLASIQLELNKLMKDEFDNPEEELNWLSKTEKPSQSASAPDASPSDMVASLEKASEDKNVDLSKVENTEGAKVLNETISNPEAAGQEIAKEIKDKVPPEQAQKIAKFVPKVMFTDPRQQKAYDEALKNKSEDAAKMAADHIKDSKQIAADIKKRLEADKNVAFKYGLGLIVIGAMFGAIMIPSMKSQLSQILDNGKPVMEKVFAALGMLGTIVAAFVPMALGSLLLYFAFSENAPEKDSMTGKIITASIVFFRSIENAVFGKAQEAKAVEQKPVETPKADDTKVNASIQQRVARLQLELAQIAHDLA